MYTSNKIISQKKATVNRRLLFLYKIFFLR
nr:MAG TPA: hypothetical protein [Caudoviricetes sp.]